MTVQLGATLIQIARDTQQLVVGRRVRLCLGDRPDRRGRRVRDRRFPATAAVAPAPAPARDATAGVRLNTRLGGPTVATGSCSRGTR